MLKNFETVEFKLTLTNAFALGNNLDRTLASGVHNIAHCRFNTFNELREVALLVNSFFHDLLVEHVRESFVVGVEIFNRVERRIVRTTSVHILIQVRIHRAIFGVGGGINISKSQHITFPFHQYNSL